MKSSGSVWFVYGVAVVVTFLVGVVAFAVFILAQVFGGPDEPATAVTTPATSSPPAPARPPVKTTAAQVYDVRPVVADDRQLVLVVATPVGCARALRATTYAEGPGAVALRVTQQAYRSGCDWQRRPVLATANRPVGDRAVIVNGTVWTPTSANTYQRALNPVAPVSPSERPAGPE